MLILKPKKLPYTHLQFVKIAKKLSIKKFTIRVENEMEKTHKKASILTPGYSQGTILSENSGHAFPSR